MKHEELKYPFEIRPLSKDDGGGYLITFPDLPGCMSDGESVDEAIKNGCEAVKSWIEVAKERDQQIPEPKTKYSGQFVQRISKSLHARLAAFAKKEGVSMNALVAQFIAEGLENAKSNNQFKEMLNDLEISYQTSEINEEPEDFERDRRVVIGQDGDAGFYKRKGQDWEKVHLTIEDASKDDKWGYLLKKELEKFLMRDIKITLNVAVSVLLEKIIGDKSSRFEEYKLTKLGKKDRGEHSSS